MSHTVIDIETLGTNKITNHIAMPNLAIVHQPDEGLPSIIYAVFNTEEQIRKGAETTASTIGFWMGEALKGTLPAQEIQRIVSGNVQPMVRWYASNGEISTEASTHNQVVLMNIAHWLNVHVNSGTISYGNGDKFDHMILEAHVAVENLPPLFEYWQTASMRSFKDLFAYKYPESSFKDEIARVAVDRTLEAFKILGLGKYHTPTKHDPVFDALVESYEVQLIKEKL